MTASEASIEAARAQIVKQVIQATGLGVLDLSIAGTPPTVFITAPVTLPQLLVIAAGVARLAEIQQQPPPRSGP